MADKIKIRRGLFADLPDLDEGELGYVKDRGTVYIGTNTDHNILLNPVLVAEDGYTIDGYLYPAIDNVHGLGTPDKRWKSISVGPGSLHIVSKSTDAGYTENSEFVIGVDPSTNKLQIASGTSVLIELDPDTGASFPSGGIIEATNTTETEHYEQQQQFNQSLIQALDGYAADSTVTEHYQQLSIAIDLLRQAADAYGAGDTEQEHYIQQAQFNQSLIQALDGYTTTLDTGATGDGYLAFYTGVGRSLAGDNDLFWDRTNSRLGIGTFLPNSTLDVRGVATFIGDTGVGGHTFIASGANVNNRRGILVEHRTTGTMTDGFGIRIQLSHRDSDGVSNVVAELGTSRAGSDDSGDLLFLTASGGALEERLRIGANGNSTVSGDLSIAGAIYNQNLAEAFQVIRQAADGYVTAPNTSSISDGYVAFFIDGGRQIAGDNDLYFDRVNNRLGIGTAGDGITFPAAKLEVADNNPTSGLILKVTQSDHNTYGIIIGNDTFSTVDTDGMAMYVDNSGVSVTELRGTGARYSIQVGGGEAVRILNNRNIGFGTATPQNKLDIEGAMVIGATYSGTNTAPTNGLLVEGNVGIGITSVGSTQVDVTQSTASTVVSGVDISNDSTGDAFIRFGLGATRGYSMGIDNSDSDALKIGTAANTGSGVDTGTFMVMTTAGSVGVGGTPINGKFEVNTALDEAVVSTAYASISGVNARGVIQARANGGGVIMGMNNTTHSAYTRGGEAMNGAAEIITFNAGDAVTKLLIGNSNSAPIHFIINDTKAATISADKNFGIGTATPIEPLTVVGPIAISEQTTPATQDGYGKIWVDTSGELNFVDDNGNNVLITTGGAVNAAGAGVQKTGGFTGSDGYVSFWTGGNEIAGDNDLFFDRVNNWLGVGTTTPTNTLTLKGSNASLDITTDADGEIGAVRFRDDVGTGQGGLFYADSGNYIGLARSISSITTSGLFIDSLGKVGVGVINASSRFNSVEDLGNVNIMVDGYGYDSAVEMQFRRAGGTGAVPLDVAINHDLGRIVNRGYFGGTYYDSSAIIGEVGGTPSAGVMPGRLLFLTSSASTPIERMRISSNGAVSINTTNSVAKVGIGSDASVTPLQFYLAGSTAASEVIFYRGNGSLSSFTDIANNDVMGSFVFTGNISGSLHRGASITAAVDGAPSSGDMPGRLVFSTSPDASATVVERMRISNGGRVTIGGDGTVNGEAIKLQVVSNSTGSIANVAIDQVSASDNDSIHIRRSRGSLASRTIVSDEDLLGTIAFMGYDGTLFRKAASIDAYVEGTPGVNGDMGGLLSFTTSANDESVLQERMRITSSGKVGIGNSDPQARLHVTGDGYFDGNVYPFTDDTRDLGSQNNRWQSLWLGPNSLKIRSNASEASGLERTWNVGNDVEGDFTISQDAVTHVQIRHVDDTLDSYCGIGANVFPTATLQVGGDICLGTSPIFSYPVSVILYNKTGNTIPIGSIVIADTPFITGPTTLLACRTTTSAGDRAAIGVAYEDILPGFTGRVAVAGAVRVLTTGGVTAGDGVETSSTAGRAQSNTTNSSSRIGVFMETVAGTGMSWIILR